MAALTFKHSGDLGDIVYALPAIRAMGGGILYLDPEGGANEPLCHWEHVKGTHLNSALIEQITPLLIQQPYIQEVRLWRGEKVDVNLDQFRQHLKFNNLADSHLAVCGKPSSERDRAWLEVADPITIPGRSVVIARSLKNQGNHIFWQNNANILRPKAVFVGFPLEHQVFCEVFGPFEYYPTPNVLTLARVIAGCEHFISNVSFPHALAEAMKKSLAVEFDRNYCPALFQRPGAVYV
jgi:hypothetical protein